MRAGIATAGAAGLGNVAALIFAVDKAVQARVDNWTWVALWNGCATSTSMIRFLGRKENSITYLTRSGWHYMPGKMLMMSYASVRHTLQYFKKGTYDVVYDLDMNLRLLFLDLRYRIRYVFLVGYNIICHGTSRLCDVVGQHTMSSKPTMSHIRYRRSKTCCFRPTTSYEKKFLASTTMKMHVTCFVEICWKRQGLNPGPWIPKRSAIDDRCVNPRIIFWFSLRGYPLEIPRNWRYTKKCNKKYIFQNFTNIYIYIKKLNYLFQKNYSKKTGWKNPLNIFGRKKHWKIIFYIIIYDEYKFIRFK